MWHQRKWKNEDEEDSKAPEFMTGTKPGLQDIEFMIKRFEHLKSIELAEENLRKRQRQMLQEAEEESAVRNMTATAINNVLLRNGEQPQREYLNKLTAAIDRLGSGNKCQGQGAQIAKLCSQVSAVMTGPDCPALLSVDSHGTVDWR